MAHDVLCFKRAMHQENDSLKPDTTDAAPQAEDVVEGADKKLSAISKLWGHPIATKTRQISKFILKRLYAFSGELFAAACGLIIAWLYCVSWLLTQQSVDVSRVKPEAERWFSQAFNGHNADIDAISLRWLPASDSVVFEVQDITVRGDDGAAIQKFDEIKAAFPVGSVVAARPVPTEITVRGGSLSWVEDENGVITAGLGAPDNVGRLGPVYRGELPKVSKRPNDDGATSNMDFQQAIADFKSLDVENTVLYFLSKKKGMDVVLDLNNLDVVQAGGQIDLALNGEVRQKNTPVPLDIAFKTDVNFARFEGQVTATGLRPDEIAPKKGRFKAISRLEAPMSFDVRSTFSQKNGLQASNISLDIGGGALAGFAQPLPFKSATFKAALEPGQQRMKVEQIALDSPKFGFSGEGEITELGALNDGDINSSPVFDIRLKDVGIDAVPTFTAPLLFKTVDASGQIDFDARRLNLPKLSINKEAYGFELAVDASQNAQTGKIDSFMATGHMTGQMGPQDLLALWPPKAADGARRWVASAIKAASLDAFKFKTNLDAAYFENPIFTEDYITAELDVSGGVVKYMRAMPALRDVRAKGRLIGNRIETDVLSGTVGNLIIEKGTVEMPRLLPIGGDLLINMTGTGTTTDMLRLVDNEPFKFASAYGVDPAKVGGKGRIEMSIKRPMLVHFDQNLIEYAVKGDFIEATAPFEIFGQKITDGNVHLNADKNGVLMSGPVKVGPWAADMAWREVFGENAPPTSYSVKGLIGRDMLDRFGIGLREYFDGTVPVEISATGRGLDIQTGKLTADLTNAELSVSKVWSKALGERANLVATLERGAQDSIVLPQVTLTGPGLEVQGKLEIGQNLQLRVLDFSKMRLDGLMNAAVQLKPDLNNQRFSIFLNGEYLDVSPWISAGFKSRSSGTAIDVPVLMTGALDRLILAEDYTLSGAKFLLAHTGVSLSQLRLGGAIADGQLTAELVSDAANGERHVTIDVPDASKVAASFLGLTSTEGGALSIRAKLPPIDTEGPTLGSAEISAFTLKDAPFLARILSLASLTGLVDTLGGDGLAFERFELPFTLSDNLLQVRGARLYGPAIGMTGEGDIHLEKRVLDFDGTVVPAYNANTVLGDVPVLGSLLGKKGEGLFALNYAVKGPFDKVQVSVNPLSALTPGFLRGIFRPKREKLPDEIMEQIEAVRPKEK